jgi:hypothetical protein
MIIESKFGFGFGFPVLDFSEERMGKYVVCGIHY